jgi:hydrogenase expression/formation protein HypE
MTREIDAHWHVSETVDPSNWVCPIPLRDTERILLGHGGGGILSEDLINGLFLPAFGTDGTGARDSVALPTPASRIAVSTDAYVVQPLFFPGGNIGDLAVNGTINDLACSGAQPQALTAAFVLEEGLPIAVLGAVAQSMGRAAAAAGVKIVAGDTKVVEKGCADQLFVITSGVGGIAEGVHVDPELTRPGDAVIVTGAIGIHGVAILSVREGIDFGTSLKSDSMALHRLVATMLQVAPGAVHALRDPTRGGLVAALVEIAQCAGVGVQLDEAAIPIPPAVAAASSLLGLDPLQIANEGKLIAFVDPEHAEAVLAAVRSRPEGNDAAIIGRVVDDHPGMVVGRTAYGTERVIERQLGEQLPRIC